MPALAACYFCGDAVGASLEEHAVPPDAPADDQVSVTLCADCHGKLVTLFEELPVGDADAGSSPEPNRSAPDESATRTTSPLEAEAPADGDADPAPPGEPETAEPEQPPEVDTVSTAGSESATTAGAESDSETATELASDPDVDPLAGEAEPIFADDEGTLLGEDDPENVEEEEENVRPFSADAEADADATGAPDESGTATDDASDPIAAPPAADATDTETEADSTPADSDPPTADREASSVEVSRSGGGPAQRTEPEPGDDASSDGSPSDDPLADVSPRTYNRVVRLLQNREFPVERHDFEALATSAYELDHGECAAALDGAIEKGLLEEREGQLHRPE